MARKNDEFQKVLTALQQQTLSAAERRKMEQRAAQLRADRATIKLQAERARKIAKRGRGRRKDDGGDVIDTGMFSS